MRVIQMINRPLKRVPCVSHPITVLFLDDNQGFLDSLELELGTQGRLITLTDPQKAKEILRENKEDLLKEVAKSLSDVETDAIHERHVDFDVSSIKNILYDKNRFNYIAVLVVDYQMPTMTGIDFCRSIQDEADIYKIMLTAEAGKDTAIEAFNEGVIDRFLLKQDENLYDQIIDAVDVLKVKYFQNLTKPLINNLGVSLIDTINNQDFINLFNETLMVSNAVEFYLLDTSGSYLFLDKDGEPTWLIIRNEEDLNNHYDILKGLNASEEITTSIELRKKLLFMLSEEEYQKPINEWGDSLYEAKKLNDTHWYSVVKGKLKEAIDWNRIVCYKNSLI